MGRRLLQHEARTIRAMHAGLGCCCPLHPLAGPPGSRLAEHAGDRRGREARAAELEASQRKLVPGHR